VLSPKQFDVPTKVHFASPTGSDVGSVLVDWVVPHSGGTSFYFGKLCVAILSDSYLMIGPRQLERSALRDEKPFWYDPTEKGVMLPEGHPLRAVLRAIA
jgi:hypothetical protein